VYSTLVLKATYVSLVMNLLSVLVGIVLIPRSTGHDCKIHDGDESFSICD
jgi:hypothetical protein